MPENVAPSVVVPLNVIPLVEILPLGRNTPPPRRSASGFAIVLPAPMVAVLPVTDECWMARPTLNRRTLPPVNAPGVNARFIVHICVAAEGAGAGFANVGTTDASGIVDPEPI